MWIWDGLIEFWPPGLVPYGPRRLGRSLAASMGRLSFCNTFWFSGGTWIRSCSADHLHMGCLLGWEWARRLEQMTTLRNLWIGWVLEAVNDFLSGKQSKSQTGGELMRNQSFTNFFHGSLRCFRKEKHRLKTLRKTSGMSKFAGNSKKNSTTDRYDELAAVPIGRCHCRSASCSAPFLTCTSTCHGWKKNKKSMTAASLKRQKEAFGWHGAPSMAVIRHVWRTHSHLSRHPVPSSFHVLSMLAVRKVSSIRVCVITRERREMSSPRCFSKWVKFTNKSQ